MTSLCGFENLVLPDTTLYAGNEPLKTTNVEHDEDPCSGAVFADIPIASTADVDAVVSAANAAFYHASWRNLAPLQRERLLHPSFPFGGMKRSGIGRENGPEGLEPYLEPKSVVMALS